MEYLKDENGKINLASMQNVDTGMWLERITAVLNWKITVYDTDIFSDIIEVIAQTLSKTYNEETKKSMRIIADHTRTSVIMISDWIVPSNVDQWYILRRLLRRAIREWNKLWNKWQFLTPIANKIISKFEDIYEWVKKNKQKIIDEIEREEKQFLNTLENGLKEFDKLLKWFEIAFERTWKKIDIISGEKAFKLYDTYWFPLEMTYELAKELWLKVDEEWFQEAFKRHQELSRVGAEQKFKWWLADNSELTTALHSATHMMLAWLRKYLGADVHQKGSNITAERLRFDFNYGERVSPEILKKVEDFVNEIITKNCEMILEEIKKSDAEQDPTIEWSFWEKYPEIVKVYTLKDSEGNVYTRELCWWPHITTTTGMWKFRIIKEESSSAWVRRIKAVLEI
jgi:alanyl-tRNA synthetase